MRQTTLKYLLLLLAQIVLWNYFNFTQYLFVAFLPAMILCLPVSRSAVYAMVVAFLTGLAADFLVTGQLGLTAFALVPVALLRRGPVVPAPGLAEVPAGRAPAHGRVPAALPVGG